MSATVSALDVALFARRFALLADRVELLRPDPRERVEIMLRDDGHAVNALDVQLVADAEALDLVCGYALRRLRANGRGQAALLDVLATLPPAHLLGIYYALPASRQRNVVRADGAWSYHVGKIDAHMPAAFAALEHIAETTDESERARIVAELPIAEERALEQFDRATLGLDDIEDELLEEFAGKRPGERFWSILEDEFSKAARRALRRWRAERHRERR
jgi:hypothetical protein